jgi:hypothetical protein
MDKYFIRDSRHFQANSSDEVTQNGMFRMDNAAPKTISVPEAGKQYFGLAKNASYEAAARGEIPVIKIGGRLRVPVCQLERMLEGIKLTELAE